MLLHTLLRQFDPSLSLTGLPNADLTGVQEDSRRVRPGELFVARPGTKIDGARFVADAAVQGAVAVVTQTKRPDSPLPQVVLKDVNAAVSALANLFHHAPSETVKVLGVTGTNGKTTTAYLVRHLLSKVGQKCGMIGTVEIDDGRTRREASMTTPGAVEVAELLATMRDRGCRRCAMEVSSHALHQGRVDGVRFAGAGFTNLTQDHFDYHQDFENYAGAKARLFAGLDDSAVAVVNADDKWAARMTRDCRGRIIRFGFSKSADYQARDVSVTAAGSNFVLVAPDGRVEASMGLLGRHNVENALLAAALVGETFGLTVHQIAAGLRDAAGAPGRLQAVRAGQPFAVLVDYAHTDDALENVLGALRPLTRGRLRVLFGCGGDRDRTKRPKMARVAQKWADAVYVTSDNPRTEDPRAILDEICCGFSAAGLASVDVEPDRRSAIERVVNDAEEGDVVLLAGKGHENYQIVGAEKRPFDDAAEATRALQSRFALV